MPTLHLTKRNIDGLMPLARRYTVWDTGVKGFGLRVEPQGARVYVFKYRIAGRQRWFTIGRHGSPWTPEQARNKAKGLQGEVAMDFDPAAKRIAARKAATFADVCELYFAEGVVHKNTSTITDRGRARLHLIPLLGARRLEAIGRADIEHLLNAVIAGRTAHKPSKPRAGSIATGGRGDGAQCVALASTILHFAVQRKLRADNPARGVKKPAVRKIYDF